MNEVPPARCYPDVRIRTKGPMGSLAALSAPVGDGENEQYLTLLPRG